MQEKNPKTNQPKNPSQKQKQQQQHNSRENLTLEINRPHSVSPS